MSTDSLQPQLLMTSKEAARRLSISERTLFTLTKAGKLAVIRIGRAVRYVWSDIEKYIDAQRRQALE